METNQHTAPTGPTVVRRADPPTCERPSGRAHERCRCKPPICAAVVYQECVSENRDSGHEQKQRDEGHTDRWCRLHPSQRLAKNRRGDRQGCSVVRLAALGATNRITKPPAEVVAAREAVHVLVNCAVARGLEGPRGHRASGAESFTRCAWVGWRSIAFHGHVAQTWGAGMRQMNSMHSAELLMN